MAAAKPIILGENIVKTVSSVTASTEASNRPAENLTDLRDYTLWSPTTSADQTIDWDIGSAGQSANTIGLVNHNLGAKTVRLQILNGSSGTFTSGADTLLDKTFSAGDAVITLANFSASGQKQYWRMSLTSIDSDTLYIGQVYIGMRMQFEKLPRDGYDPEKQIVQSKTKKSPQGNVVSRQNKTTIRIVDPQFLRFTDAWYKATLFPWLRDWYQLGNPFFYAPDQTNFPKHVFWLQSPDNRELTAPTRTNLRDFVLMGQGRKWSDFTT